jgi:hypothetical protein
MTLLLREQFFATCHDDMAKKLVFSPSEDELLVHEVQNNSVLYSIADENFKNNIIKNNIWKHISTTIGKSGKYLNIKQINIIYDLQFY